MHHLLIAPIISIEAGSVSMGALLSINTIIKDDTHQTHDQIEPPCCIYTFQHIKCNGSPCWSILVDKPRHHSEAKHTASFGCHASVTRTGAHHHSEFVCEREAQNLLVLRAAAVSILPWQLHESVVTWKLLIPSNENDMAWMGWRDRFVDGGRRFVRMTEGGVEMLGLVDKF